MTAVPRFTLRRGNVNSRTTYQAAMSMFFYNFIVSFQTSQVPPEIAPIAVASTPLLLHVSSYVCKLQCVNIPHDLVVEN